MAQRLRDNTSRAMEHARVAAHRSIMKGISKSESGVSFMARALVLIYDIDLAVAAKLVKPLTVVAHDILHGGLIDDLADSQGVTAAQAEIMIADARAKLNN